MARDPLFFYRSGPPTPTPSLPKSDVLPQLVCMVTRCFLSMLTICGAQLIESARNFV